MPELNSIHLTLSDSSDIINVLTSPEVSKLFTDKSLHHAFNRLQSNTDVPLAQRTICDSESIQELLANRELVQKIGKLHTKLLCDKV